MTESATKKKILSLGNLTFMGAILGLAVGVIAPEIASKVSFLGEIFMVLLRMMIVPLIFVSVFLAVAKQAGEGQLSRFGTVTILYFMLSSLLAGITGILCAGLLPAATKAVSFTGYDASKLEAVTFHQVILSFFPPNIFQALAKGEIIQIVVFSIFMGVACVKLESKKRDLLVEMSSAGHDLIMTVIQKILYVAPVGIFALVASVVGKTEMSSFSGLGWLFIAITVAMLIHSLITLPLMGFLIGRFNPYKFLFNVREALIVAVATASSSATLPVSTRVLEEREGVSAKTTGFVLPLGATLNMDGSALYQALVILFLGGMVGIDFTFGQKALVLMFVMFSSAGTAGIPGGGIVMMGAVLTMVGIPLDLIGIYLLVDRFWDPLITAVNVQGDLFSTKTIDRYMRDDGA